MQQPTANNGVSELPAYSYGELQAPPDLHILTPPPPSTQGFTGSFRPVEAALDYARTSLAETRTRFYSQDPPSRYPFRSVVSSATGLAQFLTLLFNPSSVEGGLLADSPGEAIKMWLQPEPVGSALFGRPLDQMLEDDLDYVSRVRTPRPGDKTDLAPVVEHVVFRQRHEGRLVYGGRVTARVMQDDRPAAVASSYFPIADSHPDQIEFSDHLVGHEEAIERARRALRYYLDSLTSKADRHWACVDDNCPAVVVKRDESGLVIYPYVGRYYLAYEVEVWNAEGDEGWRVIVDARKDSPNVLGWPENLTASALLTYATSGATLAQTTAQVNLNDLAAGFCEVRWHADHGGLLDLAVIAQTPVQPDSPELEAANVAYHAKRVMRFFENLGAGANATNYREDSQRAVPYFEIAVAKGGSQFDMGYTYSATRRPIITFLTGRGFSVGLRTVDSPAQDPEVVCHETAHGLMAVMNSEPWVMPVQTHPFGRALIEGYATYFARALAVDADAIERTEAWARAAYKTANNFRDRYLLDRIKRQPGADLLPVPNLYPPPRNSDPDAIDPELIKVLALYDVGMIWARALWGLRLQSVSGVDQLALSAYFMMPGWLSSFETVAESLLAAARGSPAVSSADVDRIVAECAGRNILAGRGVHALIAFGGRIWAGTSAGYYTSTDNGQTWSQQPALVAGDGVRALATDGNNLYAATSRTVYEWQAANGSWSAVGNWPTQQVPLCLAIADGSLFTGTGDGVWVSPMAVAGAQRVWSRWHYAQPFHDTVLDIALAASGRRYVYAASLAKPMRREAQAASFSQPQTWRDLWATAVIPGPGSPMDACTAVALRSGAPSGEAYAGTYATGIWRETSLNNRSDWSQFVAPATINNGAVLGLLLAQDRLYVAATSGAFEFDLANGQAMLQRFGSMPAAGVVTRILPAGNNLIVGTANNGLFVWDAAINGPNKWRGYPNIGTE